MRKRIMIAVGVLGVLAPFAVPAVAQQQTLHVGPAVLPGVSNEPQRNKPAAPKKNTLKQVSDFLTTPIIKVAAFVGVRKQETKPAYQVRREQMYQMRREQHRDEMMKMRSPR